MIWNVILSISVCESSTGVDNLCSRECSERICELVESVMVTRGDFNVKIDACVDKASRRIGNKENIAGKEDKF